MGENWKVVFHIYHAHDQIIVSNKDARTGLTFTGDAEALKNMNVGCASVEIEVQDNSLPQKNDL